MASASILTSVPPSFLSPLPSLSSPTRSSFTRSKKKSKPKPTLSQLITQHRSASHPPIPESLLIRDVICLLQGINGEFVWFLSDEEEKKKKERVFVVGHIRTSSLAEEEEEKGEWEVGIEFKLQEEKDISDPNRVLIHQLAEMGWLFRKIDKKINSTGNHQSGSGSKERGMIEQSLFEALKKELTEYYRFVALLEVRLENVPTLSDGQQEEEGDDDEVEGRLTLKKVFAWTEEMRLRLRMMTTLVEEAGSTLPDGSINRGGLLLTSLHLRTSHGDPFIKSFSSHLLTQLSVPFFSTLASWIYEGELRDPFGEFFVMRLDSTSSSGEEEEGEEKGSGDETDEEDGDGDEEERGKWKGKFGFRKEMLPGFLEEGFGRKILSTGKSLNFIKYNCSDSSWVTSKNRLDNSNRVLQYSDLPGLERSITLAYSSASQRLFEIFFDKFKLLENLKNLKDYMLLGKGDFVESLMENLGPSLARPANTLYRHNLTSVLSSSLLSSLHPSSHYTPSSPLNHLDIGMLPFTSGELGWDVFYLEYKVEKPLDTILGKWEMKEYGKVFRHLWRVKRVEWALEGAWRRAGVGRGVWGKVPELAPTLHEMRLTLSSILFFVRQSQYFFHLEVIACAWQEFEEYLFPPTPTPTSSSSSSSPSSTYSNSTNSKEQGRDLDSLIEAHRIYLKRISGKALLSGGGKRKKSKTGEKAMSLLEQFEKILGIALMYQETVDSLCNYAITSAGQKQSLLDVSRGLPPPSSTSSQASATLLGIESRLSEYSTAFHQLATTFVAALGKAPDYDLRFLSIRLNFNGFFMAGKERSETK